MSCRYSNETSIPYGRRARVCVCVYVYLYVYVYVYVYVCFNESTMHVLGACVQVCVCVRAGGMCATKLLQRVEAVLGTPLVAKDVHFVRLVSPTKSMYCISFPLPPIAAVTPSPLAAHHLELAAQRDAHEAAEEDEDEDVSVSASAAVAASGKRKSPEESGTSPDSELAKKGKAQP